jgi:glucose/arabinose dehydrogenase
MGAVVFAQEPRQPKPEALRLPDGYRIEAIAINLSVPTTAIFDQSDLLIAESGWAQTARPRVLRLKPDGSVSVVVGDGLEGPITGLLMIDGTLYISHKGKVSAFENGRLRDILTDLPSNGDHQNNKIVRGGDGKIYMGQGTVTNSGVVGVDSYIFGWLPKHQQVREIPCKDITLAGQDFETENPLTPASDTTTTGPYQSFGTRSQPNQVIKGDVKCGGSIVRFNPDGSGLELVAWGLRNPFGLQFDAQGKLWTTFHGADVRGSRDIYNDPDYLVQVEDGAWYGWPEFFDGQPVTADRFVAPGKPRARFLWKDHPPLRRPFATFQTHSGANGLAFSPGGAFGFDGDAFIAMFGAFVPMTTGVNLRPAGFNVVRVNMQTGQNEVFASNVLPGPHFVNRQGGFDRPSDLLFAADTSLYIIDWGSSTVTTGGLKLVPQTGVVWRVYPERVGAVRSGGPVTVQAASLPEAQREPEVRNVPEFYRMIREPLILVGGFLALVIATVLLFVRSLFRRAAR